MSDLIVIALLRTSSDEVKITCTHVFYNLLCHITVRAKLLEGDLWWAVMRLSKTGPAEIKDICANMLLLLSSDRGSIGTLRKQHHIMSFLKEISSMGSEEFFSDCLSAVHNILKNIDLHLDQHHASLTGTSSLATSRPTSANNYDDNLVELSADMLHSHPAEVLLAPFTGYEITACIQIGVDGAVRCTSIKSLRNAFNLLLRCAQEKGFIESAAAEFMFLDVVGVLLKSRGIWGQDVACSLCVARLFWELFASHTFVKSCLWEDLDGVLHTVLTSCAVFEVVELLSSMFLTATVTCGVSPSVFTTLSSWQLLRTQLLSKNSTSVEQTKMVSTIHPGLIAKANQSKQANPPRSTMRAAPLVNRDRRMSSLMQRTAVNQVIMDRKPSMMYKGMGVTRGDGEEVKMNRFHLVQSILLAVFTYSLEDVLKNDHGQVTEQLVKGLLSEDLVESHLTRLNIFLIVHLMSEEPTIAGYLIHAGIFKVLLNFISYSGNTKGMAYAQQFCASFLRNISLHSSLRQTYIAHAREDSDNSLNKLIKEVLNFNDGDIESVVLDVSIFLFNSCKYLINGNLGLSPKFVLSVINMLSPDITNAFNTKHVRQQGDLAAIESIPTSTMDVVLELNKFNISTVLSKYSFTSGVDPPFVQSMFNYMKSEESRWVPTYMSNVQPEPLPLRDTVLNETYQTVVLELEDKIKPGLAHLQDFYSDESQWRPIVSQQYKQSSNIILKIATCQPVKYNKPELSDAASSITAFEKIVKTFQPVKNNDGHPSNQCIYEEDVDMEEDDNDELASLNSSGSATTTTTDVTMDDAGSRSGSRSSNRGSRVGSRGNSRGEKRGGSRDSSRSRHSNENDEN